LLVIALVLGLALAQEPASAELPPPGPPPPAEQVADLAHDIALGLRCPVCQGLSVAESPSPTARQMYDRVKELVAQGYTEDQIDDYFVGRYGEWVLLEPPVANNPIVWLGPAVMAGIGLAAALATAAAWRKTPEPLPSDLGAVPKDEYERRLLEELDK
jgi:cytochrome c-type biogenesis protein CcmH